MNYIKLVPQSTSNGPGIRVVLFVAGCRNQCPGCQNPDTWCFTAGRVFTPEIELEVLHLLSKPWISGLTLCGGEPMEQENQKGLISLLAAAKIAFPEKNIWCYTGYEWEDFLPGGRKHIGITHKLLEYIDVLITGRYQKDLRDITNNNQYRGSKNQRIVDVKKSLVTSGNRVLLAGIPNND